MKKFITVSGERLHPARCFIVAVSLLLIFFAVEASAQTDGHEPQDSSRVQTLDSAVVSAYDGRVRLATDGFDMVLRDEDKSEKSLAGVLKNAPAVDIRSDGVGMIGKDGVAVYVDGKIVKKSGRALSSYLESIPAGKVRKIKIRTIPSAKYDADNNVGIIEIETDRLQGIYGRLRAEYGQNSYPSAMGAFFLSYDSRKFSLQSSLSADWINYVNKTEYWITRPDVSIYTFNPKKWASLKSDFDLLADWRISEKTKIGMSLSVPTVDRGKVKDIENFTRYSFADAASVGKESVSNGMTEKRNGGINAGIFLEHRTSGGGVINADVYYAGANSLTDRTVNTDRADMVTSGRADYRIATSSLDASFRLWGLNFSTGAKFSYVWARSLDNYSGVIEQSSDFSYRENTDALYLSLSKSFHRWSFNVGARAEYMWTEGRENTLQTSDVTNRFRVFPTVSLRCFLDEKEENALSLQYAERIVRPGYQQLNPFRWYINPGSYSSGNPNLSPSVVDMIELSYMYRDVLVLRSYCQNQRDIIGNLVTIDEGNNYMQVEQANNYLSSWKYGLNLYAWWAPADWYMAVFRADASYSSYKSKSPSFAAVAGFAGMLSLSQTFTICKGLEFNVDCMDRLPGLYNYRKMKNSFILNLQLSYFHRKSGVRVSLEANDLLANANPEYTYSSTSADYRYRNSYDSRSLLLGLSWTFGSGKRQNARAASNIEEVNRIK